MPWLRLQSWWKTIPPFLFVLLAMSVPILDSFGNNIFAYNTSKAVGLVGGTCFALFLLSPRQANGMLENSAAAAYLAFSTAGLLLGFFSPVDIAGSLTFQIKLLVTGIIVFAAAHLCKSTSQALAVIVAYLSIWMFIYMLGLIMYLNPGEPVRVMGYDFKPSINYWKYDRYRLMSVVGNTYIIGFSFVLSVPFILYLYRRTHRELIKWFLIVLLLFSAVICMLTFSKTIFICLALMGLFHWSVSHAQSKKIRSSWMKILLQILIPLVITLFALGYGIDYLENKYNIVLLKSWSVLIPTFTDKGGRSDTWGWLFSVAERHGWHWSGLGSGQMFTVMVQEKGFATGCDSGYLAAFLEKGPFGVVQILIVYGVGIWQAILKSYGYRSQSEKTLASFYRMKADIIFGFAIFDITMQNFDTIGFQSLMILFILGWQPSLAGLGSSALDNREILQLANDQGGQARHQKPR